MMRVPLLMAMLAIGGCNNDPPATKAEPPPPNHFSMVAIPSGGGVYVLDTQEGTVALCTTTLNDQTWCTPSAKADLGMGPPPMGSKP